MRWANWPNQNTYNQFDLDAMFSSDTQSTAIHQIKSNTGGFQGIGLAISSKLVKTVMEQLLKEGAVHRG